MTLPDRFNDIAIEKDPAGADAGFAWRIRRAGADKPLNLVLVSADWFGIRTHYHLNRTRPHYTTACPACDAGMLPRWSGYLLAIDYADESRILWEFTPAVHDDLVKIRADFGTLRAQKVQITRAGKRSNGRLQLSRRGPYSQPETLPDEVPIMPALFHIWGIPLPDPRSILQPSSVSVTEADVAPTRTIRRRLAATDPGPEKILGDLPGQLRFIG